MEEIDQLVDMAQRFLSDRSPVSRMINVLMGETEPGFDRALWQEEAELGLTGLIVSEAQGGSELGYFAQGRLIETCAKFLVPEPFLSSVCLALPLLIKAGAAGESFVEGIATGTAAVAVALPDDQYFSSGSSPVQAELAASDRWQLSGEVPFVLDYPNADSVMVPAETNTGLAWFVISSDANVLSQDGLVMDGRIASRLTFNAVEVDAEALLFEVVDGKDAYQPIVTHSAVLLSSWMLGMSEHVFSITLEYLRTREQYGALIGSYQALQHRAAQLHCDIQVARCVIESALHAVDQQSDDAEMLVSAAKARAGELVMKVTSEAIQMHGGMGMTEEVGVGLYYKAAKIVDWLGGSQMFHQTKAAHLLGIARNV